MSDGETKLQRENQKGSDCYWKIVDDLRIYNRIPFQELII
jgi:hypothetical protein